MGITPLGSSMYGQNDNAGALEVLGGALFGDVLVMNDKALWGPSFGYSGRSPPSPAIRMRTSGSRALIKVRSDQISNPLYSQMRRKENQALFSWWADVDDFSPI